MRQQVSLFQDQNTSEMDDYIALGNGLFIKFNKKLSSKATLYNRQTPVKEADLSDRTAKKLFVVEAVEMGAVQLRLADAIGISRQTIYNYVEIKKRFGIEGLIHSYSPEQGQNLQKQRQANTEKRMRGNKAKMVAEIRKQEKAKAPQQLELDFSSSEIKPEDQPYSEEHAWEPTRYAGIFAYIIALICKNDWYRLIIGYFGDKYQLFMVFLLMVACDIRSIEQIKNLRTREAGVLLGIRQLPNKMATRLWLKAVGAMGYSRTLLNDVFGHQIRTGTVGLWFWYTDGHLLPYTGKHKVHSAYNTQRSMPVPGRTSMVTTDSSGRIVDFTIQEGKGDLRQHILDLNKKWASMLDEPPVMVFDREGYGAEFFYKMLSQGVWFVTWEKHIDASKLNALQEDAFGEPFSLNGKQYRAIEDEKPFTYKDPDGQCHVFKLRRVYLWNVTSKRKTAVLSDVDQGKMSTQDVALAILNRWGASENTFKHMLERVPMHYQPGFGFVKSERQEIANPELKPARKLLGQLKKKLSKTLKAFSKTHEVFNKDGSLRQNSAHQRLKAEMQSQEAQIKTLHKQIGQMPERVDLSELERYDCFERICNESKYLFDFVTSMVWNARKQLTEWLFPYFENGNEYIDLFYAIANCQGWIKSEEKQVVVRLEPLQQKVRRAAQEQLCRKLTQLGATTPTGKALVIEIGNSPIK